MDFLLQTLTQAWDLLSQPSSVIWSVVGFSFSIAIAAILLALFLGIPCGALLALKVFPGRKQTATILQGSMGFPPVLTGLLVSLLFWPEKGPLNSLNLYQTPTALVITQTLIILPIIIGFTLAGIRQLDPRLITQFRALGASSRQLTALIIWEIRFTLLGAVLVSCGRLLSEVGAAWMTGGNISGYTRVMSVAIATETVQGNLAPAVALGIVLLAVTACLGLGLVTIINRVNKHEYSH